MDRVTASLIIKRFPQFYLVSSMDTELQIIHKLRLWQNRYLFEHTLTVIRMIPKKSLNSLKKPSGIFTAMNLHPQDSLRSPLQPFPHFFLPQLSKLTSSWQQSLTSSCFWQTSSPTTNGTGDISANNMHLTHLLLSPSTGSLSNTSSKSPSST